MFYRDTQALVIHLSWGTCTRGDIVIHISFAFAQYISQRDFKKVMLIVAYLEGVALELYESRKNLFCRVTSFSCPCKRHIFFCGFYWTNIKSDDCLMLKHWQSLSFPEMTPHKLWVLNAYIKIHKIYDFFENIRQDFNNYWNTLIIKKQRNLKRNKEKK